jgi:hypothetical protein
MRIIHHISIHLAITILASYGWCKAATKSAVASGNWTAAGTWNPSGAPAAGDDVVIPSGMTVTYDSNSSAVIHSVSIQGELIFSVTVSTNLTVGKLIVNSETDVTNQGPGKLTVGYQGSPIPRGVTATIQLAAVSGDVDSDHPAIFCHGGRIRLYGASLANPWTRLTSNAPSGATTLTVADSISDWRVGDSIIIVGSRNSKSNFSDSPPSYRNNSMAPDTEERTIAAIDSSTKTITLNSALSKDHSGKNGHYPEVANLTRTVVVKSLDPSIDANRGHMLIGKHSSGYVYYSRFEGLGKEGILGRYPVHVHMADSTLRGFIIRGNAVINSHNKFYVVHRSNYITLRDNIGYRCFTAGYLLEDATETYNLIDRNLSVLAMNGAAASNEALDFLTGAGWGFWWANGRNTMVRNSAAECDSHGFFYEIDKVRRYYSTTYSNDTVLSAPCLQEDGTIANKVIRDIPLYRFDNNVVHAAKSWSFGFSGGTWTLATPSVIKNNTAWTTHYPLEVKSDGFSIRDFKSYNSNYGFRIHWNSNAGKNSVSNITMHNAVLNAAPIRTELGLVGTNVNFISPVWENSSGGIQLPNRSYSLGYTSHVTFQNMTATNSNPNTLLLSGQSNSDGQLAFVWFNNWFGGGQAAKVKDVAKAVSDGLTYSVVAGLNSTSTHSAQAANYAAYTLPDETDDFKPHSMITSLGGSPIGLTLTRGSGGSLTISGAAADDRQVSAVRVNGVLATAVAADWSVWTVTLTDLPAGAVSFTSVASDASGKTESTGHSITVNLN